MGKPDDKEYKTRRLVGIIDTVVTIVFLLQIILFIIYPLLQKRESNSRSQKQKIKFPTFQQSLEERRNAIRTQEIEDWPLMFSPNPHFLREDGWPFAFLGIWGILAFLPLLGAVSLIYSGKKEYDVENTLELTRFWMQCNTLTIGLVVLEFIAVVHLYMSGQPVMIPIPTLVYLCIRGIFTSIISKHVSKMEEFVIPLTRNDLLDGKVYGWEYFF